MPFNFNNLSLLLCPLQFKSYKAFSLFSICRKYSDYWRYLRILNKISFSEGILIYSVFILAMYSAAKS